MTWWVIGGGGVVLVLAVSAAAVYWLADRAAEAEWEQVERVWRRGHGDMVTLAQAHRADQRKQRIGRLRLPEPRRAIGGPAGTAAYRGL